MTVTFKSCKQYLDFLSDVWPARDEVVMVGVGCLTFGDWCLVWQDQPPNPLHPHPDRLKPSSHSLTPGPLTPVPIPPHILLTPLPLPLHFTLHHSSLPLPFTLPHSCLDLSPSQERCHPCHLPAPCSLTPATLIPLPPPPLSGLRLLHDSPTNSATHRVQTGSLQPEFNTCYWLNISYIRAQSNTPATYSQHTLQKHWLTHSSKDICTEVSLRSVHT